MSSPVHSSSLVEGDLRVNPPPPSGITICPCPIGDAGGRRIEDVSGRRRGGSDVEREPTGAAYLADQLRAYRWRWRDEQRDDRELHLVCEQLV